MASRLHQPCRCVSGANNIQVVMIDILQSSLIREDYIKSVRNKLQHVEGEHVQANAT